MDLILGVALTLHLASAGEPNEVHPFIEVEAGPWSGGVFLNSIEAASFYATYTLEREGWFAEAGIVTGYKRSLVLPYGRVGYSFNDNSRVFVAPSVNVDGSNLGAVLGIGFRF